MVRRRLYHCARCLYAESSNGSKGPALLRPWDPHSPSNYEVPSSSRVSLSPDSMPKLPPREWIRNTASPNRNTSLGGDDEATLKKIKQAALDRRDYRMKLGQQALPPVPAPRTNFVYQLLTVDAVHCVIWTIPLTFLSSDVKRLVPFDPTIQKHHPLTEGSTT